MADRMTGGCQCGDVRYELEGENILTFYRCHCRECQKQASSAFGLSLKIPRTSFHLVSGELDTWQRVADSGRPSVANFCRRCGTRVYHGAADAEVLSIKAGLLDDIAGLRPIGNIWTDSALPWVAADDGVCFPGQPPSYEPLISAWKRR